MIRGLLFDLEIVEAVCHDQDQAEEKELVTLEKESLNCDYDEVLSRSFGLESLPKGLQNKKSRSRVEQKRSEHHHHHWIVLFSKDFLCLIRS